MSSWAARRLARAAPLRLGHSSLPAWQAAAAAVGPLPLWLGFTLLALLWRAPGLLQNELNYDESLYRLIGRTLAEGTAPYVAFWDRKPVGTFVITGATSLLLGDSLAAFRLVGAVFVGTSAWLLALAGRAIFPSLPLTGIVAGLFYVVFSIRNGGAGTNTEHYLSTFALAGLCLLVTAARAPGGLSAGRAVLAGLAFGCAVQVKQYAAFDALAAVLITLLVAAGTPHPPTPRAQAGRLALVGLGAAVPTLAAIAWYLAIGRLGLWVEANVTANLGLVPGAATGLNLAGAWGGIQGFMPLVLVSAATLLLAPLLPQGRAAWRGWLGLALWLLLMGLFLVVARRFADHFFLQVLPALAMTTGFGLVLAAATLADWRAPVARLAGPALLGLVLLLGLRPGLTAASLATEVLWRRHVEGLPHWGDRVACVAATLRPRVDAPDQILVFSRWIGVHALTGTRPPTRFPFVSHLWAGYAPVDGPAEIARILATRPRFIVVEDEFEDPATIKGPEMRAVFAPVQAALAADYVKERRVGPFISWRGGHVDTLASALVFRRRDLAEPADGLGSRVCLQRAG